MPQPLVLYGPPSLVGARAKIDWAKQHFSHLKTAIESREAVKRTYTPAFEFHPQRKSMKVHQGDTPPNDIAWPLMLGDIVHNLRSALDHIACQLAIQNGKGIDCCDKTTFPICLTNRDFREAAGKLKKLISADALAFIKRYQPYKCPNPDGLPPECNNLWIVSHLNIIDKHRILIIGAQYFEATSVTYTVDGGPQTAVPIPRERKPLIDGAEICTIDVSSWTSGEEHEMRVKVDSIEQVCFSNTGLAVDGEPVLGVLIPCIEHVENIVATCGVEFFK